MGEVKNYIGKKEKNNFVLGLCGQNMVYSLIGTQRKSVRSLKVI